MTLNDTKISDITVTQDDLCYLTVDDGTTTDSCGVISGAPTWSYYPIQKPLKNEWEEENNFTTEEWEKFCEEEHLEDSDEYWW